MFNFCHNNYIKYGWGNQLYGRRQKDEDKFWFQFGKCEKEPQDFRTECIRAAKLIYESTEKKLVVHFSGGIDGEIVCRSFLENKIPFEVCIWKYKDNLNEHDINFTFKFCKEYDIPFKVLELDIINFLQKEMYERYNHKFFCPFWFTNLSKWAIEQTNGYQIFGDGNLYFNHDPLGINAVKKPVYIPPTPFHPSCYSPPPVLENKTYKIIVEAQHGETTSFMEEIGKEGCQGFFHYTPELLLSYIRDDMIKDWLNYCKLNPLPKDRKYPTISQKNRMHVWVEAEEYIDSLMANCTLNIRPHIKYKYWPELEVRPKYNGLEKIRTISISEVKKLASKYPYNSPGNEIIAILADDFIEGISQY